MGSRVRTRKADARRLGDIVDAHENQIEPPRADAARFEIDGTACSQSFSMMRFKSSGSPTGSANRSSARGTSGGISEVSASLALPSAWSSRSKHVRAKTQAQAGARLARQLRHALDADIVQ